jgi:hypothetical protein
VLGVVLPGLGWVFVVEIPFLLALGWITYVVNILPRVRLHWSAVAAFVIVLIALFAAGHGFLAWFCARMTPSRTWRTRDTGVALGLLIALFATSMATTGIAHQAGWLAQTGEPLVEIEKRWEERVDQLRTTRVCHAALESAFAEKRFALDKLPPSDADVRIVPLGIESDRAAELLIVMRDPGGVKARAGVVCAPNGLRELAAGQVAEELERRGPNPSPAR